MTDLRVTAAAIGGALVGVALLAATAVFAGPHRMTGDAVLSTTAPVYATVPGSVARPSGGVVASRGVTGRGVAGRAVGVDERWVRRTAMQAGVPVPAVRAYGRAVLLVGSDSPGCDLGWTTLAGIGNVESVHGTIGGRTLLDDGHSSTPILGPALNGEGDVAAIRATAESTTWHGDPDWDHALGPLQFIPSTWARWASDGDGDGVADPNDLDDAAYAAGRYLCADGHDLSTGAGWGAAVFSYNHAQVYIDAVYAAATAYAERTG